MTVELFGVSIWLGDPTRFILVVLLAALTLTGVLIVICEGLAAIYARFAARRRRRRREEQEMLERRIRYGGTVRH